MIIQHSETGDNNFATCLKHIVSYYNRVKRNGRSNAKFYATFLQFTVTLNLTS